MTGVGGKLGLLRYLRNKMPDRMRTARLYRYRLGQWPNLSDPKRMSEKISWLKLYGMTPLHVFCTDKITAPAYIESRIGPGRTPRRLLASYDVNDLDPRWIDVSSCMVKTNHDCGGVEAVADVANADWPAIRRRMAERLGTNFYRNFRERQYKPIRPGILVEELLPAGPDGAVPDLKLFCFNGEPVLLRYLLRRRKEPDSEMKKFAACSFNTEWQPMQYYMEGDPPPPDPLPPPPVELDRILMEARALAAPFPLVRVDFLLPENRDAMVGELTFTPSAGLQKVMPDDSDMALGALINHRASVRGMEQILAQARALVPRTAGFSRPAT